MICCAIRFSRYQTSVATFVFSNMFLFTVFLAMPMHIWLRSLVPEDTPHSIIVLLALFHHDGFLSI